MKPKILTTPGVIRQQLEFLVSCFSSWLTNNREAEKFEKKVDRFNFLYYYILVYVKKKHLKCKGKLEISF